MQYVYVTCFTIDFLFVSEQCLYQYSISFHLTQKHLIRNYIVVFQLKTNIKHLKIIFINHFNCTINRYRYYVLYLVSRLKKINNNNSKNISGSNFIVKILYTSRHRLFLPI